MIKAFGKRIDREKAYEIIINDYICAIVYARLTDHLESILLFGWKGLFESSDKELEECIDEMLIENQPQEIQKEFGYGNSN